MSDFNDNWQLTGSSDPATPDIQPHQVEAQAQAQPVFQQAVPPFQPVQPEVQPMAQPVYQQPVAQPAGQPMGQPVGQPVMQPMAQPVYQQPVAQPAGQPMVQPVGQPMGQPMTQPVYQQPVAQPAGQPMAQPGYTQQGYAQPVMQGYGYPGQPVYQQPAYDYNAEIEKNLNECERMISHFSPKVDVFQSYEQCKTDIARYSRTSIAPLVWGIIVSLFGLVFVFSAVTAKSDETILQNSIAAGIILLFGGGLILLFALKKNFNKKKTNALYEKLGELSTELNLLYNGFSNCILPPEYVDPRILFKIKSLIISGRLVTINNALNAMLTSHNTYMRVSAAKAQFEQDTAARFDGKPAYFNAVRYFNLR